MIIKKNFPKLIFVLTIGLFLLSFGLSLATEFTLDYPDFATSSSPAEFVDQLYTYALGISASLAVMMIIYGGVKYAVNPGNQSALSDAKDIIQSSVWGIVLLAGAFLILNTVNPSLTELKNPGLETVSSTPSVPTGVVTGNDLTHADAVRLLNRYGIYFSSSGGCSDPNNSSCTSFEGFPKAAMCKLIEMKHNGASDIRITAGTETGHNEHGIGKPYIDLGFANNFNSRTDGYILKQVNKTKEEVLANLDNFSSRLPGSDNNSYVLESKNGRPNHWHIRLQLKNTIGNVNVNNLPIDSTQWEGCKTK